MNCMSKEKKNLKNLNIYIAMPKKVRYPRKKVTVIRSALKLVWANKFTFTNSFGVTVVTF